jgi:hypothetical protein
MSIFLLQKLVSLPTLFLMRSSSSISSKLVIRRSIPLMTAGLVFLYIIHGLKIMLALWASPQINFSKEKKEKKKALSTGGKWKAVKVFEKKVL